MRALFTLFGLLIMAGFVGLAALIIWGLMQLDPVVVVTLIVGGIALVFVGLASHAIGMTLLRKWEYHRLVSKPRLTKEQQRLIGRIR